MTPYGVPWWHVAAALAAIWCFILVLVWGLMKLAPGQDGEED